MILNPEIFVSRKDDPAAGDSASDFPELNFDGHPAPGDSHAAPPGAEMAVVRVQPITPSSAPLVTVDFAENAGSAEPGGLHKAEGEQAAELEYLKQMLKEQQDATLRAVHSMADLQTQLSDARTEIEKSRTQYQAMPKGGRQALANQAAELSSLKAAAARAQADLQREQRTRYIESTKAAEKIEKLQVRLEVASIPAPAPARWRMGVIWVRACIILMTLALIGLAAFLQHSSLGALMPGFLATDQKVLAANGAADGASSATSITMDGRQASVPDATPYRRVPRQRLVSEQGSQDQFTQSLDRLDYALAAFPGRKAEDVLREVYKRSRDCALVWNQGRPSLVFGGGKTGPDALATTISGCADAVEQLESAPAKSGAQK